MRRFIGALALAVMAICTLLLPFLMNESPSDPAEELPLWARLSPEERSRLETELRDLLDFVRPLLAEREGIVYEDMLEKSSGSYDRSLLNKKLAERLLPLDGDLEVPGGWSPELDLYMLNYARSELLGKHPSIPDAAAVEKFLQLPQFTALRR